MYCTSCGKKIPDDALFCRYCGKPTPQGDELAALVAAARIGTQDAISALYEKTYSKVYYTVKSMIKDEDAVFDIVQDTYIKAFAHLDSFQGDARFLPWVRQIAANTARDWLKKKRPMLFAELGSNDEQETPVEELFPDERSENLPDQVIDQKETKRLIREIIEELPEDQRAAIGMFYYEEMSVKAIAAAMGVSESAVKSRLMYGRSKIEKKVRELEKQGTKLYSLSPLPFLLLLFRNQNAYATEVPDSRILHAILASQPLGAATTAGAAQGSGTAGAAAGTEAAGAAAAGGLGALKIGLLVLAAVTVVGLGSFGAVQIASRFAESQEPSAMEDVIDIIDQKELSSMEDVILQRKKEHEEKTTTEEEEHTVEKPSVEFVEPTAEDLEYYYDAAYEGVIIIGYHGEAQAIRIPAELDGDPVKQVFLYYNDKITHIELPDSVTVIGEGAFVDCISLTEITIPDSVTAISSGAFANCISLTEITIPDSVTVISGDAFVDCISLTEITIPDSVTAISGGAFAGCSSLTEIAIPDSVTVIGEGAFSSCSSLRNLTIPDGVTIKNGAFSGCDGLKITYQGQEYTYANDPGDWWR